MFPLNFSRPRAADISRSYFPSNFQILKALPSAFQANSKQCLGVIYRHNNHFNFPEDFHTEISETPSG